LARPFDKGAVVGERALTSAAASCTQESFFPDTFNAWDDVCVGGTNGHKVSAVGKDLVVRLINRKSTIVQKSLGACSYQNVCQLNVATSRQL